MAFLTVSNRYMSTYGAFKREFGEVTFAGSAAEIQTKLGRIISFRLQAAASGDRSAAKYINSTTASTDQDDPGVVHVNGAQLGSNMYYYEAIGVA